MVRTISGNIIRCKDTPADLNASSSLFSPRLPKVIKDANNTAKGNAMGIRVNDA
jgi:hypothetical protein